SCGRRLARALPWAMARTHALQQMFRRKPNARDFAERALRNISPGSRGSVRLDVEGPDDLGPFLGFVGDELAKVGGRAHKRCAAQVSKLRFRLGVDEYRIDLPVELVDDLGGRALWRAHPVPRADLVAWNKLAYGRKLRYCLRAHRAGHRKSAQLAGSDVLDRRRKGGKQDLRLPTEQGYKCGPITAIRHVDQVDASHRLK